MCTNTIDALEFDASTAKRAQYEAFDFELEAPGLVTVRNESHENADEHSYRVNVKDGIPVACECPSDTYHDGACKHRVAVAIREPVLEAATDYERTEERKLRPTAGRPSSIQQPVRPFRNSMAMNGQRTATAYRRLRTFRAGRVIVKDSERLTDEIAASG